MCALFIEQSVVLFNWKQGVTLSQWTGHSRDVTKVSIYAVFSLSCMILTLLFQTHFLVSFWQSMVEEACAGFFLSYHTYISHNRITFPHTRSHQLPPYSADNIAVKHRVNAQGDQFWTTVPISPHKISKENITNILFIYHFVLTFYQKVILFQNSVTYWLAWLVVIFVRQLGLDSWKTYHLVITEFAHG